MIEQEKSFFKTIGKSLNPLTYSELSGRSTSDAFRYFFSLMLVAFALLILLSIPKIVSVPNSISDQLESFSELTLDISTNMTSPVLFSVAGTTVFIDTRIDRLNHSSYDADFIMTKNYLYVRGQFGGSQKEYLIDDYKNILSNRELFSSLGTWLFVLVLPSLLVLGYVGYAVKYILLITLATIAGILIAKILKFSTGFSRLFRLGMYCATPALFLDVIGLSLGFGSLRLHIILFVTLFILGAVTSGKLEELKPKNPKSKISIRPRRKHQKDFIPSNSKGDIDV